MPLDRFQESSPVSVSNRGGRIDTSTDQAVTKREAAEEGDSFPAAAAPVRNVRSRTTDGLFNPAQAARPAHSIHVTTSTATPTLNSVSAETAPADEDGSIQPDALPVAPYAVGGFASPPAVMLQLSAAHKHIALESRRYQAPSCPLKFTRVVDLLRSHGSDFRVNVRGYFSFFPASDLGAITNGKIWKLMLYAVPESGEGKAPGIPLLMSVPDNVPLSTLFPDLALDRPPEVVQLDVVILNAVLIGWHGRSDRWLIVDSQTSIFSNPSVLWRRGT
ncbi:hypothetical protein PSEUBRA_006119 [Kalmanozyma brasiliensis GHG001]|uniref:uncharacterized protein n=1 Tax=Kalmanozyma brasiliensis (strain GHG001) TaxID=1365824 RepID=UPI001CE779F1|nr:uncharacterized protein PSEUBRA_006119 [Kalmanozyma brasiliensis GHG001]KAF6767619.1 hypothetical protein PSEUBRA_006119 [Kalmanozyma brasiliensis GHG001]